MKYRRFANVGHGIMPIIFGNTSRGKQMSPGKRLLEHGRTYTACPAEGNVFVKTLHAYNFFFREKGTNRNIYKYFHCTKTNSALELGLHYMIAEELFMLFTKISKFKTAYSWIDNRLKLMSQFDPRLKGKRKRVDDRVFVPFLVPGKRSVLKKKQKRKWSLRKPWTWMT